MKPLILTYSISWNSASHENKAHFYGQINQYEAVLQGDGMVSELTHTILLVEDELQWQLMLTSLCREAGFQVVQVLDANAARHQLRSLVPQPILAIVDLKLNDSSFQGQPAPWEEARHEPSEFDGLQLLATLRDQGVYTMVISGNIYKVSDSLIGRPEILRLVDKAHFVSRRHDGSDDHGNFGSEFFIPWLHEATQHAEAALHAEGRCPDQQNRLRHLLF